MIPLGHFQIVVLNYRKLTGKVLITFMIRHINKNDYCKKFRNYEAWGDRKKYLQYSKSIFDRGSWRQKTNLKSPHDCHDKAP